MKDRKAWHSAVHGVAKSRTWLSDWTRRHQRAIKTAEMWGKENALQWVKSYCALFLLVHLLKYEQWAGEIDKLNEKYPWKVRELDRTLVVTPGWEVTYWQSRLLQQPDFEVQNLKGKENTLKWARHSTTFSLEAFINSTSLEVEITGSKWRLRGWDINQNNQ